MGSTGRVKEPIDVRSKLATRIGIVEEHLDGKKFISLRNLGNMGCDSIMYKLSSNLCYLTSC